MEINLNLTQTQAQAPSSNGSLVGAAAPQTADQRADVSATRVVSPKESSNLGNSGIFSGDSVFQAIKTKADAYVAGRNKFLPDMKFTVYSDPSKSSVSYEYYIRFTDLSTGDVQTKTGNQLFDGTSGGDLLNGSV